MGSSLFFHSFSTLILLGVESGQDIDREMGSGKYSASGENVQGGKGLVLGL